MSDGRVNRPKAVAILAVAIYTSTLIGNVATKVLDQLLAKGFFYIF